MYPAPRLLARFFLVLLTVAFTTLPAGAATKLASPVVTALPAYTKGSSVTLRWAAGKNGAPGGYNLQWSLASTYSPLAGAASPASSATSYTVSSLASGKKVFFRILAKASSNGAWTASGWVTASTTPDSVAPTAALAVPASGAKYALAPLTLSGTASDATSGISRVEVAFASGGPWTAATGTTSWTYVWTPASAGSFTVYARSTDGTGNVGASVSKAATIVAPPTVAITAPGAGSSLPLSAYTVRGTAASSGSTISKVEVAFSASGPWVAASGTGSWTYGWTPAAAGSYTVYARATDALGQKSPSAAVAASVVAPPAVVVTDPGSGSSIPLAAYTVRGTASSTGSTVTAVEVGLSSSGPWTLVSGTGSWTYSWTPSGAGAFTIYARATDAVGNRKTSAGVSTTVVAEPAVAITAPGGGSSLPLAPFTVTGTASSPGSTVTTVEVGFSSSGPWTAAAGTGTWTYAWTPPVRRCLHDLRAGDRRARQPEDERSRLDDGRRGALRRDHRPASGGLLAQAPYTVRGTAASTGSTIAARRGRVLELWPLVRRERRNDLDLHLDSRGRRLLLAVRARDGRRRQHDDGGGGAGHRRRAAFGRDLLADRGVRAAARRHTRSEARLRPRARRSSKAEVGFNDTGPWTARDRHDVLDVAVDSLDARLLRALRARDRCRRERDRERLRRVQRVRAASDDRDHEPRRLLRSPDLAADDHRAGGLDLLDDRRVDVGFTSDGPWNPAAGTTSWSYSWTPPAPGAYTIYARARDQTGNVTATDPVDRHDHRTAVARDPDALGRRRAPLRAALADRDRGGDRHDGRGRVYRGRSLVARRTGPPTGRSPGVRRLPARIRSTPARPTRSAT